ncbi:SDR family oxidoreductase [Actinoplanes utahensis]|uniref:NmrA family transcriptional regulator n=1 Tax=Actinoplanes utahensis TaxID=1869 RepID=A0A0A6UKG7_ACTUT|nr:SDR family oxidoreductase [Actinoplanes utahensis]KHD75936.1 NmrA family transcriptional regulator [Actinoplanes utahensis]GIF35038.1 LysR family transcriptional regulator [Actinoplanes utahensis]
MRIVVVGGTGQTGRLLVEALRGRGHEAVPASPSTGIDAFSGVGLEEALAGTDVVIDVTNPPSRDEAAATEFFRVTSENLTAVGGKAGVRHHVVLSIIGLERASDLAYYRAKLAQEAAVRAGEVPYTIVRAAQFLEFLGDLLQANTEGDEIRLGPVRVQPIALSDLVSHLVEIAEGDPAGGTVEAAGPEVLAMDEIGRRLAAPGQRVKSDGKPFFGADVPVDALVAGPSAHLGRTTLSAWLAANES